ncbi:MAG TPA: VOC family protein [Ktedonobacterales bacterium]
MFGWQVQVDPARNSHLFEPQTGPGGAFVQVGETTGAKVGEVLIYVFTDDIDATLAKAEALGAKTLTPKTAVLQGGVAVFADPAGNRVALYADPSHP